MRTFGRSEAVINQHIFKVESNIDRRFHKYLLDYKLADLTRHAHGSGMVHITRGRFDSVPVIVPVEWPSNDGSWRSSKTTSPASTPRIPTLPTRRFAAMCWSRQS
ncbi:MAG: restriction endonuclease subunit S [Actinomycetales bacterium]|uniref:Restriction endonuclease subunit S n=1 Tax=Candidatus Phosphoribacter hodrii TaxID=2953743 RepID=A0A9D7TAP3_9MICO|nr:restriction endonuclease subunit S [Candidatus Phosphoribacter hodrii]